MGSLKPVLLFAIVLSLVVIGQVQPAHSNSQSVEALSLGPPVQVTFPSSGPWQYYFWVNADPVNSKYLMVCGLREQPRDNRASGVVIASTDGGMTWRQTLVDSSTEWVSEDACSYGNDGRAYFGAGMSNVYNGLLHHQSGWFHFYASKDRGRTWGTPSIRPFVDFPSITVDKTHIGMRDTVYVFGNAELIRALYWQKQPSLLTSRNGGISFYGPIGPTDHSRYISGMPSQALVLPTGEAIVAVTTSLEKGDSAVQLFATTDGGKTLKSRAVIHDFRPWGNRNVYVSNPVLAWDNGKDRFRGRLYVAWTVTQRGISTMYLGWSDDRGHHWRLRSLLKGSASETPRLTCGVEAPHTYSAASGTFLPTIDDTPGLAVANGILGLTWAENGGETIHFAASQDGGRTFGKDAVISTCTPAKDTQYLSYFLWGFPYKESWGAHVRLRSMGKTYRSDDEGKLGLSIRIDEQFPASWSTYLIADAAHIFHIFWAQPGPGGLALWTRVIAFGNAIPKASMSTNVNMEISDRVVQTNYGTSAEESLSRPLSDPKVNLVGLRDTTQTMAMDLRGTGYDAKTGIFSARVVLINTGHRTLRKPFMMRALHMQSEFGIPHALYATSTVRGDPVWDVSGAIPGNGLRPGMMSRPFTLAFYVEHLHITGTGDAVSMNIKIYVRQ